MEFSVNHPIIFVIVGIIIAVVLAQSVYFLMKSIFRARKIGMDKSLIKKTIITSALFTIAPAVAIVITVMTLSQSLGIALPWLRLSVVGSLSYEAVAAANAASGMGTTLAELARGMDASSYVTIAIVMTVSIMVGIWLVPVIGKKLQALLQHIGRRSDLCREVFQYLHVLLQELQKVLSAKHHHRDRAQRYNVAGISPVL